MKRIFLILFVSIIVFSCTDDKDEIITNNDDKSTSTMLHFKDEESLKLSIENENSTRSTYSRPLGFTSLMDIKEGTRSTENETYYEALGYDTLIPNVKFAELLNINGELSVSNKIIKITPEGTYIYDADYQNNIDQFISNLSIDEIKSNTNEIISLSDKVQLIKTFNKEEIQVVNNEELPDDYFDSLIETRSTNVTGEPDYDSFQYFSADRGGFFGKLIQSIIGSTKASTINYSKKRRLRGSFYFYNYGVYAEIGVQGWTDKKNWIGWSKSESDELRVSWRNVVLEKETKDYYKETWDAMRKLGSLNPSDNNSIQYMPPKTVTINNRNVYGITVTVTDTYANSLKDKAIQYGVKYVFNELKNKLQVKSEIDKAEALVIAGRTKVYMIYNSEEVKKYNVKKYTHVFSSTWMNVMFSWSNTDGFQINGIGPSNAAKPQSYLNALSNALNENKPKLISGEVTVCARLGNVWKGMKIVKK